MKGTLVIYCDRFGQEHDALVFAVNPLNDGFLSLVYVDESKKESDNIVKLIDVQHMSKLNEYRVVESSRIDRDGKRIMQEEGNKHLPTYHLNCWKEKCEPSNALPSDHPAYDHPHRKNVDDQGNVVHVARPEYDADVAAHNASAPQADGYEPSSEGEPDFGVGVGYSPIPAQGGRVDLFPPDTSPAANDASAADGADAPSATDAPSAADLDAVAADETAADATSGSDVPEQSEDPVN